jgi:short subunit dehydrogenase-like uncharacterized protein
MAGRIVLFGATGYTGDLTARAMVARGLRPVLAARNAERLARLAGELGGLETQVADVGRPETVRALVERGDVLVTTVGPFKRWGEPAVTAAVDAGAHYLDSTGEGTFIRAVFERYGPRAAQAGVALLTAMGYDWVPGNLAGALALRDAGDAAVRVDIGYFAPGAGGGFAASGGTRASAAGIAVDPSYAWRGARLVTEPAGRRVRAFALRPGRAAPAISAGSTEAFSLPRVYPGVREIGVYLGWFGGVSRVMPAVSLAMAAAGRIPGFRAGMDALAGRFVKGSTGGPDADARTRTRTLVLAEAFDASGSRLADVRLEGGNPYDLTAALLAWGAERAVAGELRGTGALGPVDGFGLEALEAGAAEAGLRRV